MRDRARALRALFASMVATAGAAGAVACRSHDTAVRDEAVDAGVAVDATTARAFQPFHCPPPYVVVLDGGALADGGAIDFTPVGPNAVLRPDVCHDPNVCGDRSGRCSLLDAGPPVSVQCALICIGGRRPEGYRAGDEPSGDAPEDDAVRAWVAELARLEAASVPAFRRMARDLARLGAPRRLVRACERAAHDEVRHARASRVLARRRGARVAPVVLAGPPHDGARPRSLEDVAVENAVEGCARETYGALVATWQARWARDPVVRAHFARVAHDETAHAALAWSIDAWARARLGRPARLRVDEARRRATSALLEEVGEEPDPRLTRDFGLPRAGVARRLALAVRDVH
jgi:hypothetical protein